MALHMPRAVVLLSIVLPVLAGQVAPQSPQTGATVAVTDVTQAPRAAEIEFVACEFQQPRPMHGGVGLFGIEGEPAPRASVVTAASVKLPFRASDRTPYRTSRHVASQAAVQPRSSPARRPRTTARRSWRNRRNVRIIT